MVSDKVRLKKALHPKIEQWCKALEITESRLVEDALVFYFRNLEGKPQINVAQQNYDIPPSTPQLQTKPVVEIDDDDPDNYDGGLEL
jgi:hypothetical protein